MTHVSWGERNTPRIFSETLPNLNKLLLYVELPSIVSSKKASYTIRKKIDKICFGIKLDGEEFISWSEFILLPKQVDISSTLMTQMQEDPNYLRLSINVLEINNSSSLNSISDFQHIKAKNKDIMSLLMDEGFFKSKLDPYSLSQLNLIQCKKCKFDLTKLFDNWKVNEMPAEYWQEMVEFWICHPEGDKLSVNVSQMDLFKNFKTLEKTSTNPTKEESQGNLNSNANTNSNSSFETMSASKTAVLKIASNYIVIDYSSFISESVTSRPNSDLIFCSNCDSSIGESKSNISSDTFRSELEFGETVKIAKLWTQKLVFNLKSSLTDSSLHNNANISENLGLVLIREILTRISAHAAYHYIIQEIETKRPVLLIWVVGWGINAYNNYSDPSILYGSENGLKVLTHRLNTEDSKSQEVLKNWKTKFDAEYIFFDNQDCSNLLQHIQDNNKSLPPPLLKMNDMEASYIFPEL
ncbi:hypothetical protein AYI70_g6391 [Smittium culicis]|uniref:Uncharacterized protein n=1 Tax=Smittium culicis TaxID=133412 RepID=A0A1R1XQ76_9FUNG|nr:hypothetical protein AYI70_g6391 [Smittium culicis]